VILDFTCWRRERMPVMPEQANESPARLGVRGTLALDSSARRRKHEIYAATGVPHLSYVDPVHHTREVLCRDGATGS
jgi:hypothetical protein